jgi:hypothetical protein
MPVPLKLYDDDSKPPDTEIRTVTYPNFQRRERWNWGKYVTNKDRNKDNYIQVSKDYFPPKGPILPKHTQNRMKHLRQQGINPGIASTVRAAIALHLKKCKVTLRTWFNSFFVEFSQHAGIFFTEPNDTQRKIKTFKELEYVTKKFKTEDELVNFYCMMYFPFDYMDGYITDISTNLMIQHRLKFDHNLVEIETNDITMSNGVSRTRKSCFDKLVSIVLNEVRKKIRDKLKKQYLLDFTLKNNTVEDHVSKNVKRASHRKPRTLHTWMLIGEFVSQLNMFYNT